MRRIFAAFMVFVIACMVTLAAHASSVGGGGGSAGTLQQTLAKGSATGGTSITVTNGDRIVADAGSFLQFNVDTGQGYLFRINGVTQVQITAGALSGPASGSFDLKSGGTGSVGITAGGGIGSNAYLQNSGTGACVINAGTGGIGLWEGGSGEVQFHLGQFSWFAGQGAVTHLKGPGDQPFKVDPNGQPLSVVGDVKIPSTGAFTLNSDVSVSRGLIAGSVPAVALVGGAYGASPVNLMFAGGLTSDSRIDCQSVAGAAQNLTCNGLYVSDSNVTPSTGVIHVKTAVKPIANGVPTLGAAANGFGALYLDYTNTATVGNVTINKPSGTVNLGAVASTLTVTNSLVTANSHIMVTLASDPGVALSVWTVGAAGSFTINTRPATVNQTAIDFLVVNAD